ncbi:MAG: hypothetical protein N2504_01535 [candidate division WOR-3 bacterium]|nr:hypothetical protein [candidate division WOR-3 bacterium]
MAKTRFSKYRKNSLSPLKKYMVYKSLCQNKSIRHISKEFKCSVSTILHIKKKAKNSIVPYLEVDELGYLIYKVKEQNPFFTINQIRTYLKEKYNLNIAASTISNKLQNYNLYKVKTMSGELFELFKILIEENKLAEASEILKYHKLDSKNYYLLEKIPDNYLPTYAFVYKIIYLIQVQKLTIEEQIIYLQKIEETMKTNKNTLNYFYLLFLKIFILKIHGKFQEILKIYDEHKSQIEKLPFQLKYEFILNLANVFIVLEPKLAKSLTFKMIKKKNIDKEGVFRLLVGLGYIKTAKSIKDDAILDMISGKYNIFISKAKSLIENTKFVQSRLLYKCLNCNSMLLLKGDFVNFHTRLNEIEKEIENYKFYLPEFKTILMLKYSIEGKYDKVRDLLNEGSKFSNTLKAIYNKDYTLLSSYRKQELVLKYLLMGNIKKAVEVANKYGLIYNLHVYALLLNKSLKHIRKYREFKNIVRLLRIKRYYRVRVYVLSRKETVYVNNTQIRSSRRANRAYMLLFYLLNEKGRKVSFKELEQKGFRNIKSFVYRINHEVGFRLISIGNQSVVLNKDVFFDLNEFFKLIKLGDKRKAYKLLRFEPFVKLSSVFPFASEIRYLIYYRRNFDF